VSRFAEVFDRVAKVQSFQPHSTRPE